MMIPKLKARDKKRILSKVNNLVSSPLFIKAVQALRQKWQITNVGLKNSESAFHGHLFATKSLPKFQTDVKNLLEQFGLPKRYEIVVYQFIFSNSVRLNSIKQNISQLSPVRILPFSFNSENADGERIVCLHLYGDTIQEDYVSAWPSVKKYLDEMMLTGKDLNRKNFVRDNHFFQTKLNNPNKTDENIGRDYEDITGEMVMGTAVKVARKRYAEWVRKHKHIGYDGYAEDLLLHRLKQANPKATDTQLAKSFYKKTGLQKTATALKEQLSRLEIYRRSNIKS
jgi:hypothetical protein